MSIPFVSGFTFIKNALKLGYPIKESIESIEPLCDEIIINVGFGDRDLKNDDGTYQFLRDHLNHPKFKFYRSFWDPSKITGGEILKEQTNIALSHCQGKICQYIQGDEIIHEKDYPEIHNAYISLEEKADLEGIVFNYTHFYGNVDIVKHTRSVYRREVRAIKNHKNIRSWRDAQGFRHQDNSKLNCLAVGAHIYHYGWARKELIMKEKVVAMDRLYHGDSSAPNHFQYDRIWGLKPFLGSHPQLMNSWIENHRNDIDIMSLPLRKDWRIGAAFFSDSFEYLTGLRIGEYKNFYLK